MIQTTATVNTTPNGWSCILSTGSNMANYNAFAVCFNWGAVGSISIHIWGDGFYPTTENKIINDGLWHNVLITYDGTTILIYVDGRLDNSATNWNSGSTATIASTLNTIGNSGNYLGHYVNGLYRWIGKLKNVQFYDYVVTNAYQLANSYQLAGSIIYSSGKYIILYINIYIYVYIRPNKIYNKYIYFTYIKIYICR